MRHSYQRDFGRAVAVEVGDTGRISQRCGAPDRRSLGDDLEAPLALPDQRQRRSAIKIQPDTAGLGDDERPRLDLPEAGDEQARLIAAQVSLARTLPDYWQRFEAVSLRYLAELEESGSERPGLLARLFRRG